MEQLRVNTRNQVRTKTALIIDNDLASSHMLTSLLRSLKFETIAVPSLLDAEQLSRSVDLVVTTFFVQGPSSLHYIRDTRLLNRQCTIFVLTDQEDTAQASHAFQSGADRVFAKPLNRTAFISALKRYVAPWYFDPSPFHRLTLREREVMHLIVDGLTSKETAIELGISHRTVDVHRSRIMEKLCARNFADLMRIVLGERSGRADPI